MKIPWPDRMLDRLEEGIFTDALGAAEDKGVVDLFGRRLHSLRQPRHDVSCVIREDGVNVLKPRSGCAGITKLEARRRVEIEACHTQAFDPAAGDKEPIRD